MNKILVIDDEKNIRASLASILEDEEYKVFFATSGEEGIEKFQNIKPDAIFLDIWLPGIDGLEICHTLRQESDIPIIMLTAMTTDEDRLRGLDLGADDYVTKPFSPRELAARVRAVLRRIPGERGPDKVVHGDLTIDFLKYEASVADRSLKLTPVEFKILGAMAKEPGRVFSRAQIIEKALGYDFDGFDRTIDVHILKLRRKLEPDPRHPRYIKTIYGAGYKLLEVSGDTQS